MLMQLQGALGILSENAGDYDINLPILIGHNISTMVVLPLDQPIVLKTYDKNYDSIKYSNSFKKNFKNHSTAMIIVSISLHVNTF